MLYNLNFLNLSNYETVLKIMKKTINLKFNVNKHVSSYYSTTK